MKIWVRFEITQDLVEALSPFQTLSKEVTTSAWQPS